MCLIVFSYRKLPEYPLILAANRDELYTRPTRKAHFWDHSDILAGKDLKKGGSWLGVTKTGKIAALTNFRDINSIKDDAPSRGDIIKNYLSGEQRAKKYLETLKNGRQFNGFNLIAGTPDELYYYTNQDNSQRLIESGNHAISNAWLDTPWPKTRHALNRFEQILEKNHRPAEEDLFEMLNHTETYPDEELPDTGLPREMERAVSSIFIKTTGYGTRSSTVIILDDKGNLTFSERTYYPGTTEAEDTVRYSFQI